MRMRVISSLRIDPKNGSGLTGSRSAGDRKSRNPKLIYGINIPLNYEGFDLAMLFKGVAGVQLFNGVKAYEQFPFQSDANVTTKALNRFLLRDEWIDLAAADGDHEYERDL